jgi:hypothetical protein
MHNTSKNENYTLDKDVTKMIWAPTCNFFVIVSDNTSTHTSVILLVVQPVQVSAYYYTTTNVTTPTYT